MTATTHPTQPSRIAVDEAMLDDFDARLEGEPAAIREWFSGTRLGLGLRLALRAAAEQLRAPRSSTLSSVHTGAGALIAAHLVEDLRSEGGETTVTCNGIVVWRASYARGDLGGRSHAIEGAHLFERTLASALAKGAP